MPPVMNYHIQVVHSSLADNADAMPSLSDDMGVLMALPACNRSAVSCSRFTIGDDLGAKARQ